MDPRDDFLDGPQITEDQQAANDDWKNQFDIQQPSYVEAVDKEEKGDEDATSETIEPTVTDQGTGHDETLLAQAELYGMPRDKSVRMFTPDGLREYVGNMRMLQQQQQAGTPEQAAPEQTDMLENFKLELDPEFFDEDQAKQLNEALKKAAEPLIKEIGSLRGELTGIATRDKRHRAQTELSEFDKILSELDTELFGSSGAAKLDRNSEGWSNRSEVWDVKEQLKGKFADMPLRDLVIKSAHFLFADKLTDTKMRARQQETEDKLEDRRKLAMKPPTNRKDEEMPYGTQRALVNLTRKMREDMLKETA